MIVAQFSESVWGEYGLSGLVIFALFTVLIFMAKWVASFVGRIADQQMKERDEWRAATDKQLAIHKEERDMWYTELTEARIQRDTLDDIHDCVVNCYNRGQR